MLVKIKAYLIYSFFILVFSLSVQAQEKNESNFGNKDKIVELNVSFASIDYDIKKCSSSESDRCKVKNSVLKITALMTYVINDKFDLYALGGSSINGLEAEGNSTGSGFEIGVGLRGKFLLNSVLLAPYTQLKYNYLSASHEGDHPYGGIKLSGFEAEIGIMAAIKFSQKNTLYSAVDYVPTSKMNYSAGDDFYPYAIDSPVTSKEYKVENRKPTYRLGLNHKIWNNKYLHIEASTGGEESIALGFGFTL